MNVRRLTRGAATPADLRAAIDELGIAIGEDFIVHAAAGAPDEAREGGVRSSDPSTSRDGAKDVRPRAGNQAGATLSAIDRAGARGATWGELAAELGFDPHRRLSELLGGGWIRHDGERLNEVSGSKGRIYFTTDAGEAWCRSDGTYTPAEEGLPDPGPSDAPATLVGGPPAAGGPRHAIYDPED